MRLPVSVPALLGYEMEPLQWSKSSGGKTQVSVPALLGYEMEQADQERQGHTVQVSVPALLGYEMEPDQ